MRILTRDGYKEITDCSTGDEVKYYDITTGLVAYNTIELIEELTAENFPFTLPTIINEELTEIETGTNIDWYIINGTYHFFSMQSIWVNGQVGHLQTLAIGDVIYNDNDEDIVVTSIETYTDLSKIFYRLRISGDSSFIADGLSLHNASRFWVLGSGTWDASTATNWSSTSGGSGGSSAPTLTDDVTFDSASYSTSYTCTTGGANSCHNLSMANPASGTLTFAGGLSTQNNTTGSITINSAVNYTSTYTFRLQSTTTGQTIDIGVTFPTFLNLEGTGEYTFIRNFTMSSGIVYHLSGTFILNGYTIQVPQWTDGSNAVAKVLTLNASSLILTSNSTCLACSAAGWTINAGTSTIKKIGNGSVNTGGWSALTVYDVWFSDSTGGTFTCANLHNFTRDGASAFSGGLTVSSGTINSISVTSSSTIAFTYTGPATVTTFSVSGPSTVSCTIAGNNTLPSVSISGTALTLAITGNNTFTTFTCTATLASTLTFTNGTTNHFTTFGVNGSANNLFTVTSLTTGVYNLILDGGGTVSCSYLDLAHSVATPDQQWTAWESVNHQGVATVGSGWKLRSHSSFLPFIFIP